MCTYNVTMRWSDATLSKEQKALQFFLLFFIFYLSLCNQAELYFRLVTCVSIVDPSFFDKMFLYIIHYFLKYNIQPFLFDLSCSANLKPSRKPR